MADSNSKKPMALLLLVVVAVLVVIMVSGGDDAETTEWAGHTALTDKTACEAAVGTWTPGAEKDDEATTDVDESAGTCAEKTKKEGENNEG